MFERNKIDNVETSGVPVEITTDADEVLTGRLLIAIGRSLADVLNGTGSFIEFEPWGGQRYYLAKASLKSIKLANVPKPESLGGRLAMIDSFDPYTQLGVGQNAGYDEVKAAWHRLSKVYHPDRYATAELPAEVTDYLAAMARRVNAAFAALEGPLAARRKAQRLKTEAVYTTPPRS